MSVFGARTFFSLEWFTVCVVAAMGGGVPAL